MAPPSRIGSRTPADARRVVAAGPPPTAPAKPSPCVGFCRIDGASGLCIGCARSAAEVASWKDMGDAVKDRVWAELPGRRELLGIGLRRLDWDRAAILRFVASTFRDGEGTWVLGIFGAVAEFCVGPGEACAIAVDGDRIAAETGRGAIRFDLTDEVRALAMTTGVASSTREVIVLAVPRGRLRRPANVGLTAIGPDREAIRPRDREGRLFDLGLGAKAAAFCVRPSSPELADALDGRIGQGWAELLSGIGGQIIGESPSRVVLSPIGRVEVDTPIPLPGGRSPEGPHTHFLPVHLAVGRETPPGLELPEALVLQQQLIGKAALRPRETRSLATGPRSDPPLLPGEARRKSLIHRHLRAGNRTAAVELAPCVIFYPAAAPEDDHPCSEPSPPPSP